MKTNDSEDIFPTVSEGKPSNPCKSGIPAAAGRALVPQFDLRDAPGHLIRLCHSRARAVFDELIGRRTGLSKQQVALMVSIAQSPAATHACLSEESGFDRNTLATTIDRLIVKGLAARTRSRHDARAYEIRLTEEGHEQLEMLIPLSLEVQKKIIEPIPEASRRHFIEYMQMLAGISDAGSADLVTGKHASSGDRTTTSRDTGKA